jgi:hypothetical protein
LTAIHILNFAIPVAAMMIIGMTVDKMCKPDIQEDHSKHK